jgi:hypothetical protein
MHIINKMLLGAMVSGVSFAAVTALKSKLKSNKVDRKSVIKAAVFGVGVGALAGLIVAKSKKNTINPIKPPFKPYPDEVFSCSEIAKEFNVSTQKVSGTAKKVGVQNNPYYSRQVGRGHQNGRSLYLSDVNEYSREAINIMASHF